MQNLKIAVTGATGLVGSHIAEYLAKKGHHVRALIRLKENAKPFLESWSNLNIEVKEANILNANQLQNAFSDIDVVIHSAGIVDPYAEPEQIFAVNVAGTKLALEKAAAAKVKQFIFLSSLSVITGNQDQYNTTEDAPLVLCGEAYADSKVKAEQEVAANKSEIAVTIMRPGFIYGPRERAWLPQLIKAISAGNTILIDGGEKETNIIYIENLNRAIEAALLNNKTYGQIYNLTDGQKISKKELFDLISTELNLPRVTKKMPSWLVRPIFNMISSIVSTMPIEKRRKLSRFSKAAYRLVGINQGFSIAKAESELNYTNRIPFKEGMISTLSYFRNHQRVETASAACKQTIGSPS